MRKTLTPDDGVADSLEVLSRPHGKPVEQIANEVRGMAPGSREPRPPRFRVVPNRSGLVPGVDPLRLNQLADQLEVEDLTAETMSVPR